MAIPKPRQRVDSSDAMQPIVLSDVPIEGGVLRFREPLTLQPVYDADDRQLMVTYPPLGLVAGGRTREELIADLYDDIHAAWVLYAQKEPTNFSPRAYRLKEELLRALVEVADAHS